MNPLISPQANLVLQIVIFAVLFTSMGFKQKRRYVMHGILTLAAVLLNTLSFVLIMGPSLFGLEIISAQPFHIVSVVTVLHAVFGIVALILGFWLLAAWRLRSNVKECFKRKTVMRMTMFSWMASLVSGFLFYFLAYVY
ncbi:MAG: hypothetical protein QW840_00320 [Candidatus Bathyarchaeia archaeon]